MLSRFRTLTDRTRCFTGALLILALLFVGQASLTAVQTSDCPSCEVAAINTEATSCCADTCHTDSSQENTGTTSCECPGCPCHIAITSIAMISPAVPLGDKVSGAIGGYDSPLVEQTPADWVVPPTAPPPKVISV